MAWHRALFVASALVVFGAAWAQSPTYGVGRTPTSEEIRKWDIAISPEGKELPEGHGTAREGEALYKSKGCAGCHGGMGSAMHAPTLISRKDVKPNPAAFCLSPCVNDANSMSLHSPFATTIWDYINRGMPLGKEGSLTPNEVYSLTAFLLFKNDVIKEGDVLDKQSLPKVKMPNRDGFGLPPQPYKHGEPRLQGYP